MRLIAPVLVSLVLAGCSGEPVGPDNLIPVATVTLEPANPVVGVGATAPLTTTTKSLDGTVLLNRTISYASANPAIATVDGQGVVTGVAAGSTQITATSEGKSASVALTVSSTPVASVTVTPISTTVKANATAILIGTAFDAGGAPLPGRVFAWTSANPAVATVTSLGVVKGIAAGTVTITGTSEGKSGTSTVTVIVPPVASVTVTPNPVTLGLGDSLQLAATLKDASGDTLSGRKVTWQTSNPLVVTVSTTGRIRAVAAGDATITATSEGKNGTAAVSARLRFVAVSAGQDFSCGITTVRTAYCWGVNNVGQLGDGTTTDRNTPVAVSMPPGVVFDSVSAGQDHACALSSTGTVYCWGANDFGQLGTGTTTPQPTPTLISATGLRFTSVSAGAQFTCALATTNFANCWGLNGSGQLGNFNNAGLQTPNPDPSLNQVVGGPFKAISAMQGHSCGILSGASGQNGTVACWGLNDFGQLGRGGGNSPTFDPVVTAVTGSTAYSVVGAGFRLTCAVRADGSGTVDCWGLNDAGQLGSQQAQQFVSAPVPVAAGQQFATVTAGDALACGVTTGKVGFCWGDNSFGQLGIGSTTARPAPAQPRQVSGGLSFAMIDAGQSHACGVTTDKLAWCWGRAQDGLHANASALGNGAGGNSNVPAKVSGQ
jgi:alpha-tubulin suppressor-like RCC1 family protein